MSQDNKWAIMDDEGIIHEGIEDEMRTAWNIIVNHGDRENYIEEMEANDMNKWIAGDFYDAWNISNWKGDIRLVEIHLIHK